MTFVQRELALLQEQILNSSDNTYPFYYAAIQALSWSLDPQHFESPRVMLEKSLMCRGIEGDSKDCFPQLSQRLS